MIGDVGGFADQLAGCLRQLGVCDGSWPADLHVIQVGDLVGGRDDVAVVDLVEPHLVAGRWTQLVGNWELGAVGAFEIGRAGRCADPAALDRFAGWFDAGLVRYAAGIRAAFRHLGGGHPRRCHQLAGGRPTRPTSTTVPDWSTP